ncbi:type II secretion system F family protein [Limnobacter humi]|uniref:Type II secretion system F family protein n=1 Tax=Limnobacter humi TaxID=1778671 RepID=A0ABT1WIV4_9BURK|nr:type II secretion system F family protein [Limnobacter humi]MCQ8897450.1 type II secretion system F family protein [Limnobacter humi]
MKRFERPIPESVWIDWMSQWAELCHTGLSALEALELSLEWMTQHGQHRRLQDRLGPCIEALQGGVAPEQVFGAQHNNWPAPLQLAVRCAQVHGDWSQALTRQSQEWRQAQQFRHSLLQSLSYPALVLFSAVGLWILLGSTVGFSIPPLSLDLPTTLIMTGGAIAVVGLVLRSRVSQHRALGFGAYLGRWKIRPALQVHQHFFTMACELEAGVDLLKVLNRPLTGRSAMEKALAEFNHHLLRSLQRGNRLSSALEQAQAPGFLVSQGRLAEHSGNLHQCFNLCARIYLTMAQQRRQRLSTWLSPMALGVSGLVILLAYQTTLAPLYQQLGQWP